MTPLEVMKPVENLSVVKTALQEIHSITESLLDKQKDFVTIKWKQYITKSWYRKIAIAFSISTEIIKEERIEKGDTFMYDFTVRATSPLGRYTESSSSCSSDEKNFTHLQNDVRATAQTRATNRSISDLIGLWEVSFEKDDNHWEKKKQSVWEEIKTYWQSFIKSEWKNVWSSDSHTPTSTIKRNGITYEVITHKQKKLLIQLIEQKYQDESTRNDLYKQLDSMTKQEARVQITNMLIARDEK